MVGDLHFFNTFEFQCFFISFLKAWIFFFEINFKPLLDFFYLSFMRHYLKMGRSLSCQDTEYGTGR